ncbi:hypothetical protein JAO05_24415 [Burkholderia pseudomallei]|uniref:hypothetical protein n=1 Tax=Burkholderia pseudomallei TaxID=28450 RepID=UPI0018DBF657|nr:hypothetical protein [Burkholderia pseudomallei]MBH9658247.1 hypothetical protein [Burkholderia pseudomallei]
MAVISLTDFVDIVSKSGTPKATKVASVKERPDYEPALDFYRTLREGIIHLHQSSKPKSELDRILDKLSDPKKIKNYPALLEGYRKWWGKKSLVWFSPPRASYEHAGIQININPELGMSVDSVRHVIKLYFKADALTKPRADLITYLMETELRKLAAPTDVMTVLDIRKAKAFTYGASSATTQRMINAELAYIASLWGN